MTVDRSTPYLPRVNDPSLRRALSAVGAVVIEGPRAAGKTETARQVARSEVRLDIDADARRLIEIDPGLVLEGETPRLIDEWQLFPDLWNHVRRAVDDRREPGQFILTGSAVPADDATRHSGAGRFARLRMRPMSLFESGHAAGSVSLADVLVGVAPRAGDPGLSVRDLADRIAIGGWPAIVNRETDDALALVRAYVEETTRVDIRRTSGIQHDPARVQDLVRALARHSATTATVRTLVRDVSARESTSLHEESVYAYLDALERVMVIEDQPAWGPHLRSRSRVRRRSKRHFVDPSVAVAALGATPRRLLDDPELFGLLFESLAIRDLRIYTQNLEGRVLHYRDNTGLEVDAVVETGESWAAFEVKLGTNRIDQAAQSLLDFAERVDTGRLGEPVALVVLTSTGPAYRRPDGVSVVSIGTLGP